MDEAKTKAEKKAEPKYEYYMEYEPPKRLLPYISSASFRMSMRDYEKHDTRFCHICGWRTGGMNMLCSGCRFCPGCRYAFSRCRCTQIQAELDIMFAEGAIQPKEYEEIKKLYDRRESK